MASQETVLILTPQDERILTKCHKIHFNGKFNSLDIHMI